MSDNKLVLVYTTFADIEQAEKVAKQLVEKKLIACANLMPGMVSVYHWQGKTECGEEVAAYLKTVQDKQQALLDELRVLHPYEVPALIVLEPSYVDPAYLAWASGELGRS
jgi:periplasmic divalent cation tolerance protein